MALIECECTKENCSAYKECDFLPTTFLPHKGRVDIIFIGHGGRTPDSKQGRPFSGNVGNRLKTCILHAKNLWGKSFGVAFSNTIRTIPSKNQNELDYCKHYLYRDIKRLKKVYHLKVVMPLGNTAKSIFIGNNIGITQDRKNIYTINNNKFGLSILKPSLHPSHLIKKGKFDPNGFDKFLIDDILESLHRIYL